MDPFLGIGWQISELHGWGIFGINVVRSLLKRGRPLVHLLDHPVLDAVAAQELAEPVRTWQAFNQRFSEANTQQPVSLPDTVIIHGFGNNFTGPGNRCRFVGTHNVGFIFFEETAFTNEQITVGRKMDWLLAGSRWNARVLQEQGFPKVTFVMQGVDTERFQPRPRTRWFGDRFVVFSGGKLEYRKGQDIALVAFREFHKRHPDALLVTAWHHAWPGMAVDLVKGPHGVSIPVIDPTTNQLDISGWLRKNGLPEGSFLDLGFINNRMFPEWYRELDVAIFPNRAEGGTNLVAMEVMACGVPCVLSANTGHLDLIDENHCYPLLRQQPLPSASHQGWGETDPQEVVEQLEIIYHNREESKQRGVTGAAFIRQANWENQTEQLLSAIANGLGIAFPTTQENSAPPA